MGFVRRLMPRQDAAGGSTRAIYITRWEEASTHGACNGPAPVADCPRRAASRHQHRGRRGADRAARRLLAQLGRLAGPARRWPAGSPTPCSAAVVAIAASARLGATPFGLANQVTLLRAGLVCLVGGALLASGQAPVMSWSLAGADRRRARARCGRWLARPAAAAGLGVRRPLRRRGRRAAAADPGAAGLAGRPGRRLGAGDRPAALRLRPRRPAAALAAARRCRRAGAARRSAPSRASRCCCACCRRSRPGWRAPPPRPR